MLASLKSHFAPSRTRGQFNKALAAVTCFGVRGATKHLHCFLIRTESSRTCSIAVKGGAKCPSDRCAWNNDDRPSFGDDETASFRFRGNGAAGLLDCPWASGHPLWSGRVLPCEDLPLHVTAWCNSVDASYHPATRTPKCWLRNQTRKPSGTWCLAQVDQFDQFEDPQLLPRQARRWRRRCTSSCPWDRRRRRPRRRDRAPSGMRFSVVAASNEAANAFIQPMAASASPRNPMSSASSAKPALPGGADLDPSTVIPLRACARNATILLTSMKPSCRHSWQLFRTSSVGR